MDLPAALQEAGVTAREAEVLEALGCRLANAEIAERLYISVRTVESHVSALLRKLDEPDRRALAGRAGELFRSRSLPVPASLAAAVAGIPLIGRIDELATLLAAAERARATRVRRLVVVAGDAGIGKTRLTAEAVVRLHADGAIVLHGRCQQEALLPYQSMVNAVAPVSVDATQLFTGPGTSDADAAAARHGRFEEFDRVLASQGDLVVLALDDVQWIDPSGAQLVHHVLHHASRSPLLIVATGRPEINQTRHPVAKLLATHADLLDVIELDGLTLDEAEQIAVAVASPAPEQTRAVWERTGGNPFLLAELLRHPPTGALPVAARDAIVHRVADLGPDAFETLAAAAVMGESFRRGPIFAAVGGSAELHDAALDRAFDAGLVIEDPDKPADCRFTHAIVREALVDALSPGHRCRLNLRLADALEALGPSALVEAASHRHAALADGDPSRALRAALDAYDHTMANLAFEVAVSLADMALDALGGADGDEAQRADALLRRGRARIKAGDLAAGTADCRMALELANRIGMGELAARAVLGWAAASPVWGRQPDLRAALEHALDPPPRDLGVRARLKARVAQLLYYEGAADRRVQLSHEAVEDARRSGDPAALAAVLSTSHAALWQPGDLDRRTAIAREIVASAMAAGEPELEAQGHGWLAVDLLEAGNRRQAWAAFDQHAALAARVNQPLLARDSELWAAMRDILEGQYARADTHIERARDLGDAAHDASTETMYWVQRYWIALERGERGEMDDVADACERIAVENSDVPAWRAALALLHVRRGDLPAAEAEYAALAGKRFSGIPHDVVWLNAMTYLAETCACVDDAEGAGILMQALMPYADLVALVDRALACKGSVHRFIGLLAATAGDPDAARHHLRLAVDTHRAMRATPLTERASRELAEIR